MFTSKIKATNRRNAAGALAALLPLGALALLVPLGLLAFGAIFPTTTVVGRRKRSTDMYYSSTHSLGRTWHLTGLSPSLAVRSGHFGAHPIKLQDFRLQFAELTPGDYQCGLFPLPSPVLGYYIRVFHRTCSNSC